MVQFFILVLGGLVLLYIIHLLRFPVPPGMSLFVGPPGSGKTSLCAYFMSKNLRKIEREKRHRSSVLYQVLFRFRHSLRFVLASLRLRLVEFRLRFSSDSVFLNELKSIYLADLDYLSRHSSPGSVNTRFWSNVPILGALKLDVKADLGNYLVEDGIVCIDEAGIDLNNRNYAQLPKSSIKLAKMYRHYGISSFMLFSQHLDVDITFMRLTDRVYLVRRSILPGFCFVRGVKKYISIDDESGQLIDRYKFSFFDCYLVNLRRCWKFFDTYEAEALPEKEFDVWNNKTRY